MKNLNRRNLFTAFIGLFAASAMARADKLMPVDLKSTEIFVDDGPSAFTISPSGVLGLSLTVDQRHIIAEKCPDHDPHLRFTAERLELVTETDDQVIGYYDNAAQRWEFLV